MTRNLVETLKGDSIAVELELAYLTLAEVLLVHRSRSESNTRAIDVVSLDHAVCATESEIDLTEAKVKCPQISALSERPGEVFDNLGHMFVLLQAMTILHKMYSLTPTRCAPTQQSKHEGMRIADMQGNGWALEAYGGVDVRNNSKLALDLRALSLVKSTLPRTFLAFRHVAYAPVASLAAREDVSLKGHCPARRGGPFTAETIAKVVGRLNGVIVLETSDIEVTYASNTMQDELRY